jgi:hypothetical protein
MIMAMIDRLWLATLTKNQNDAGTDENMLNLTINVDGEDLVNTYLDTGAFRAGQANLSLSLSLTSPIDSNLLTNSSIRLGHRNNNAWRPQSVLLLGKTERRIIALAMETELMPWLSADSTKGKLTMPLRLVSEGNSSTLISRVMLLVRTSDWPDSGTDDPIQLQITAGGNIVLQETIGDTPQIDLEEGAVNWHFRNAAIPFTRSDVLSNGGIRLSIIGTDKWLPESLFLYGLDTADGRPNEVVHLVSIPAWNLRTLSTEPQEGEQSISLPVI